MMRFLFLLLALFWPLVGFAQNGEPVPAALIADELFITQERELVARGNVEAFQGTSRLQAQEIRYNRTTGALIITGPITIRDGENITILATAAELDPTLQRGLLTGARMVLNQQLQLSAVQIERVNGRYNQLYKTAVTSCKVCEDGRPPLWQIRAKRVIHDREAQQLYFDQAQFRIRNLTILNIPRLRLPDPTLERATGFLIPSLRSTSQLGTGIKIPYFIKIGDDKDLTLTPYLSSSTRTLELRYRQAFRTGDISLEGAITRDDIRPDEVRGYFFGDGAFALKNDFRLTFDIEVTTDDAYLQDYGFSSKDRLDSAITVSRARRDEFISAGAIVYKSLRDDEENSTLPTIVADAIYEKRMFPTRIGGELRLAANVHSHFRTSDDDIVGRDVSRVNLDADWLRGWTLAYGIRAEATLGADADIFNVTQDSTTQQNQTQIRPRGAITFRYPMTQTTDQGVTLYLEPVLQFGWQDSTRLDLPNEESTRVEFDAGNLLSLSRFPAPDRRELGRTAAYGINWARFDPNGSELSLTVGQVLRDMVDDEFSQTSGLDGASSNFLVAGQIKAQNGWAITARTLFDDSFVFAKAEVRGGFNSRRINLNGSYLWLTEDPGEARLRNISEISLDGSYRVDKHWTTNADWRFDLADDRAATAGVGFTYNNECVTVNLSIDRRFTSSTSLEPTTSLGFTIGLRGFSARKGTESYARTCGT